MVAVPRASSSVSLYSGTDPSPHPIRMKANKPAKDNELDLYAITIGPMLGYRWIYIFVKETYNLQCALYNKL